jgi:hypothetical protein
MIFSHQKKSLYEDKLGSSFLPPINMESRKRLDKMPVLRLDNNSKALSSMCEIKKPPIGENNELTHSFDPLNVALPKYSSKYKNGNNAGAIRHLLGGRQDPGARVNSIDLKSSNLHWILGLRYYNPKKDL